MKVKELIVMLEKLDEDLELVCMTNDEDFLEENQSFRLLEINSVDLAKVKLTTSVKTLPTVKLKQSAANVSEKQVVIELSAYSGKKNQQTYERRSGIERRSHTRSAGFSFSQRVN